MKNLMVVKKLIELFGKMDGLKILTYGAQLLSLLSGLLLSLTQKKVSDKIMKEELEKAVQQYFKQNGGVQ